MSQFYTKSNDIFEGKDIPQNAKIINKPIIINKKTHTIALISNFSECEFIPLKKNKNSNSFELMNSLISNFKILEEILFSLGIHIKLQNDRHKPLVTGKYTIKMEAWNFDVQILMIFLLRCIESNSSFRIICFNENLIPFISKLSDLIGLDWEYQILYCISEKDISLPTNVTVVLPEADLFAASQFVVDSISYMSGKSIWRSEFLLMPENCYEKFLNYLQISLKKSSKNHTLDQKYLGSFKKLSCENFFGFNSSINYPGFITDIELCDPLFDETIIYPVCVILQYRTPKESINIIDAVSRKIEIRTNKCSCFNVMANIFSEDSSLIWSYIRKMPEIFSYITVNSDFKTFKENYVLEKLDRYDENLIMYKSCESNSEEISKEFIKSSEEWANVSFVERTKKISTTDDEILKNQFTQNLLAKDSSPLLKTLTTVKPIGVIHLDVNKSLSVSKEKLARFVKNIILLGNKIICDVDLLSKDLEEYILKGKFSQEVLSKFGIPSYTITDSIEDNISLKAFTFHRTIYWHCGGDFFAN